MSVAGLDRRHSPVTYARPRYRVLQGQAAGVFGQGQRERAGVFQVFPEPVQGAGRAGGPDVVHAQAPVQRVRQPHQVVEARGERDPGADHPERGRRRRGDRRSRGTPTAAAAAADSKLGTTETA